MGSVISSRQFYRTDRAISWFVRSWFVQLSSRRDHGMNQPFRPLTCVFALAVLAGLSSDAAALARHKPIQHAKKAAAASRAGHQRHTALKKGKHAAHVTAARREPPPSSDPPPQAAASPWSGDLAAAHPAIGLP